jgi:NitT/TauT family transport system substrate-binding protein
LAHQALLAKAENDAMQKHSVPEIMIAMTSALVLEAVLLVGQAFAQEGKGVKVRIAQAAIASAFAPYWVASQRGMFKSNGIDVDLTLLGPAASSQALASDDIDILSASGEGINLRAEGMDVKYFGTVNHVLDFGLYARKGGPSSISAREFEGKSIAVTSPGSATDIFARYILAQYSIDHSKLKFLFTQGLPAIHSGLSSGQFDLGGLSVPLSLYAESDMSIQTLIASGQARVPGTTASLIAKTSWIRNHETEAKAILRSLSTSVRWMRERPEETQEIIAGNLKIKDKNILQKIYSIYTKIWGTPNLEADQAGLKIALMYSPTPKAKAISIDDLIYENNKLARTTP